MPSALPENDALLKLYRLEARAEELAQAEQAYGKSFEEVFPGYLQSMTRFRNKVRKAVCEELRVNPVVACESLPTGALALELKDGQVLIFSAPQGVEVSNAASLQEAREHAALVMNGAQVFTQTGVTNSELQRAVAQQLDIQELDFREPAL